MPALRALARVRARVRDRVRARVRDRVGARGSAGLARLGRIRLPAVLHACRHALAMGPSGLLRGGPRVANLPVAAHGLHIGLVELLLVHPYEMEGHRGRLSEQLA